MSKCVYDDNVCPKEQKRGERIEMVVEIYESADTVQDYSRGAQTEQTETNRNVKIQHTELVKTWSRYYILSIVCVLLLCVLLLTTIIVLWVRNNNLTVDRDQLQASYNNMTLEIKKLRASYDNVTMARDQLQRLSKLGWKFLHSSLYYISTTMKNWVESRKDCRERGADLVIINSNEEQTFVKQLVDQKAWIGLSDVNKQNMWTWVDGTLLTTAYWRVGEPSNYAEDCVVTRYGGSPVENWADFPCTTLAYFICEREIF